ncbi:hypothetical protein [Chryseobacterium tongliaoense]|uniref:hypothetical protein n=1 Tax=Chryseobacterium tongliaoense TaxID=3240933 RepID=UPI0035194A96
MKKLFLFMFIASFFSCQTNHLASNDATSKNKKLYNQLYSSNGNIFTIGSSEFKSSYMWSYTNDDIIVYNLSNGKVISEKKLKLRSERNNQWLKNPSKDDDGIDKCIAVDGFTLMYKVKNNESFIERRFPLEYECMKNSVYESTFFKTLIEDVNYYNIGWKKVQ